MSYKVLICEDQSLLRQLFSMIVTNSENYCLAGALSTSKFALEFCETNEVDLIIMDIVMSDGSNGLDSAEKIKQLFPEIKILIVTSMPESEYLKKAKKIGIDSFWYKEIEDLPLIDVMGKTMRGENIFPDRTPVVNIGLARSNDFSERELQILRLMTTGMTDPEIAHELKIGYETVRTHVKHMTAKTGLSRIKLAIEARVNGIAISEKYNK